MTNEQIDQSINNGLIGGLTGTLVGYSLSEWLLIGGFLVTLLSFIANIIHKRAIRRQDAEHKTAMRELREREVEIEARRYGESK